MFCKKNGGYIAIIIGVLVAISVANKSHAEIAEGLNAKPEAKGDASSPFSSLNVTRTK